MRALALAVLPLVVPGLLVAQSDSTRVVISGMVLDPLRQPIEGAEVRVVGGSGATMSNKDGRFRLLIPRAKEMLVQIRRPGYNAQLLKMVDAWEGVVLLQPGAVQLPEIRVTARYAKPAQYASTYKFDDFFRRQRQGLGLFIGREEIDRRAPLYTGDLLQARAGIKASINPAGIGSSFVFARCNERTLKGEGGGMVITQKINVYIDGRRVMLPLQAGRNGAFLNGELLEVVNVHDIEMMEIFRGPGELPPEFNDGNCGAIVIWTKSGED